MPASTSANRTSPESASAFSATSASQPRREPAAVVDREQEAPRERRQSRVLAQAAVELGRRSRPSRRAQRAWRPASGLASTLRTSSCSAEGSEPGILEQLGHPLARCGREPADLQVGARGQLDDAVPESRGACDRLELARRDAAAGQAHARQPAVLRRVQRDHAGTVICPGVSQFRSVSSCWHAARPGCDGQSDAVAGAPERRRRGMIV